MKGLSNEEVIASREKYGANDLVKVKKETILQKFIISLSDPIIKILLIALGIKTVVLFSSFDWYETIGILLAIFIASFISTISEFGSEKAFEKLQEEISKIKCKVIRSGNLVEINIEEIVKNDIILLEAGDKISADGYVIEGNISVDESSLNGESKEKNKVKVTGINPEEKSSLYRGSVVVSGTCYMKVDKVGKNTFYGRLAKELQDKQPDSPLKLRLRHLARVISRLGYICAFLIAVSYLFNVIVIDNNFNINLIVSDITNFEVMFSHVVYALTLSVTIIIVAVPEGLPMMITLVLSSNMKRMIKDNVLVRKLMGIETAGNINILFTDKTGTLTKGNLEVISVVNGDLRKYYKCEDLNRSSEYEELIKIGMLCNNESSYNTDEERSIGGNTTSRALMNFFKSNYNGKVKILNRVLFDSRNKYSSITVEVDGKLIDFYKGAREKLFHRCTNYYNMDGDIKPFYHKKEVEEVINSATNKGIRVIVMTTRYNNQYNFLGLVLIKDELRSDAKEGVSLVKKAHVQTVMITGDDLNTAIDIAREVGIYKDNDLAITSVELNQMSDEEVVSCLRELRVVARSLPQDKSRLVKLAQSQNLVVGMTGDGVNDAPALKKADVGFAMGSGSEISKEASSIVILDNNFLSIAKAILFGRTIFKSIRKFIIFQLTVNLCAVSVTLIGPFIGIDVPVTVIQMLWINMVMDTLAGIAFSFEVPLEEYMDEVPKKKDEMIINKYMLGEILFTGIMSAVLCILFLKLDFFHSLFRVDGKDFYFLTAFFGVFIFMGIFNCFNARTHRLNLLAHLSKNKIFVFTIIFIILVQVLLIYYGGELFRTIGLNYKEFSYMIMFSLLVIPIDLIRKIYLRKKGEIGGV